MWHRNNNNNNEKICLAQT